jgi:hypothetical protein
VGFGFALVGVLVSAVIGCVVSLEVCLSVKLGDDDGAKVALCDGVVGSCGPGEVAGEAGCCEPDSFQISSESMGTSSRTSPVINDTFRIRNSFTYRTVGPNSSICMYVYATKSPSAGAVAVRNPGSKAMALLTLPASS